MCAHETAFLVDFIFIETFQLQTYALISPDFFFTFKIRLIIRSAFIYICAVLTRNVNAICPQNVSESEKVAAIIFLHLKKERKDNAILYMAWGCGSIPAIVK